MDRTIVVLANSVKNKAHCVAGKCLRTREWIRPVGNSDGSALNKSQIQVTNPNFHRSYDVKPLQKINMKFLQHVPLINQPENWLIDNNWRWTQSYRINHNDLKFYLDTPESIWGEGDRLSYNDIQNHRLMIHNSLYLIRVNNLHLYYDETYENKRRKAAFIYNGINYRFSVTDPNFDHIIPRSENFSEAILCISLGEPYSRDNCCYKLIATIFVE